MNRKSTYTLTIVLFIAALFFIFFRFKSEEGKKEKTFYELKDRSTVLSAAPGWADRQEKASNYYQILNDNPDDKKTLLALTALFLQEARSTGDYMYYDKAAMHQVDKVLKLDPKNTEALTYKALIYLSQHHFSEGLEIARQIEKEYPHYAFNHGILVDAYVEMGDYNQAIISAENMVSARPDLRSYSRISYLREIHGDYPGAIEAMKKAVNAGMPGDESTEWSRVQLGQLYEHTGDLKSAEMHYTIALESIPSFANALAGLGRIAIANKDYKKALQFYQKADSSLTDYSFKEKLATLYIKTGEKEKGEKLLNTIIEGMTKDAEKGIEDESIGHYSDKELAYAYMMGTNYDKALEHALAEFNRRPANIDVNEAVAWAYYKKGNFDKAIPFIQTALKTGSKNPALLCRAGLIYAKSNDAVKAKSLLSEALKNNPNMDEELKEESNAVLKTL